MTDKPPTLAFDLERDLRTLAAMASNLTPYLYEQELYGHLSGDLPRLTLGGLLLRLHRLSALSDILDPEQQTVVHDARLNFEAERAQWAVHYDNKLQFELQARVEALARFLDECAREDSACAVEYPIQAEKRTMIEHLRAEAAERNIPTNDLVPRLAQVDTRLKRSTREGAFISDARLVPAYPQDRYWWLYSYWPEDSP
ncbi:MAG: hypothetical protein GYB65_05090 [Chloroflexi bacterium]|nr:hypothetical protein [Chloroflexota bacterium]